jgi:hypothetical protein
MSGGDLVRVSDADRDRTVAILRDHLVDGRLSLEEFTQRMTVAYAATSSLELATLVRDLPAAAAAPLPERRRSAARHLVAIFGSTKRTGTLRVHENLDCLAIFGSVILDLRGALIEGDVVNVQATSIFGSVDVIVPEGVEVDLTGVAIFGSKGTSGKSEVVTAAAPFVRVRSFVLFGATNVKIRPPHAELEE